MSQVIESFSYEFRFLILLLSWSHSIARSLHFFQGSLPKVGGRPQTLITCHFFPSFLTLSLKSEESSELTKIFCTTHHKTTIQWNKQENIAKKHTSIFKFLKFYGNLQGVTKTLQYIVSPRKVKLLNLLLYNNLSILSVKRATLFF